MKQLSFALLSALTLIAEVTPSLAQQSRFSQKVDELLAARPKIRSIYAKSEVAKHVIEQLAEQELMRESGSNNSNPRKGSSIAAFDAKNISRGTTSMESETSVAISRKNKDVIVAGANDDQMYIDGMPAYYTTNGGSQWKRTRLPLPESDVMFTGGDPVIVPDEDGGFYYAYLSYNFEFTFSDIQIAHSTNGINWTLKSPVVQREDEAFILEDKEWIAVDLDPQSQYYGRLYVAWRRFDMENGYYPLLLSWSDDKAKTWSEPKELEYKHDYFVEIQCGKGGTVFISASEDGEVGQSHGLLVSTDGGASFVDRNIANFNGYPNTGQSGHTVLKGESGFRAYPYSTVDVNPETNEIFVVAGTTNSSDLGDLVYHYSSNMGKNWKHFNMKKAGDNDGDRFMPAVSFDQKTKRTWASFYSSEEDADNIMSKVYRVELTPTGFGQLDALQTEAFDPFMCVRQDGEEPFFGDYMDSDAHDGRLVTVWGQSPDGRADADVFATVTSSESSEVKVYPVYRTGFDLSEPLEQPVKNVVSLKYEGPAGQCSWAIYDGKLAKQLESNSALLDKSEVVIPVSSLANGFYYLIFSVNGESVMRKFVKD